jgi:hypothetical protein
MLLLPLLGFLFISLLVMAGAMALSPATGGTIERRLGEITGTRPKEAAEDSGYSRTMIDSLKRIGTVGPHSASELGKLQRKLLWAGYRNHEAIGIFWHPDRLRPGRLRCLPCRFDAPFFLALGAAGLAI